MKTKVATLLCVCYVALLVQPVAPLFADALAHVFWNSEHIATVHYENGSYHVHVEVKKASENSDAGSSPAKNGVQEIGAHVSGGKSGLGLGVFNSVRLVEHTRCCHVHNGYCSAPAPPPWIV